MTILFTIAALALAHVPLSAHRLDEYLQATILSIEKTRVGAQMTLTPGVAVYSKLIAGIDRDGDGTISTAEQDGYARQVLDELQVSVDGRRLVPRLVSLRFPTVAEMKDGLGEIQLDWEASVPEGGPRRRLILENHHQSQISAYLVNCLVSRDASFRIGRQERNFSQSHYQVDYEQADAGLLSSALIPFSGRFLWLFGLVPLLALTLVWRRREAHPSLDKPSHF